MNINNVKTYGVKKIELSNGNKKVCYLIKCEYCQQLHYKAKYELIRERNKNKKFYCSIKCCGKSQQTKQNVICTNCNKNFYKFPSQISKSKSKNNFCSKSCAATFNNKNKKFGTRRSKIEQLIENMLLIEYPNLEFVCNKKYIIGSELDFYFPNLKLAIQINGPLHYKPIYGKEKLDKIQKMDEEKRNICKEMNIKLIELNHSEDKYLNKNKIKERLSQIKNILVENIMLLSKNR